jgi:hypothetical protein
MQGKVKEKAEKCLFRDFSEKPGADAFYVLIINEINGCLSAGNRLKCGLTAGLR